MEKRRTLNALGILISVVGVIAIRWINGRYLRGQVFGPVMDIAVYVGLFLVLIFFVTRFFMKD